MDSERYLVTDDMQLKFSALNISGGQIDLYVEDSLNNHCVYFATLQFGKTLQEIYRESYRWGDHIYYKIVDGIPDEEELDKIFE